MDQGVKVFDNSEIEYKSDSDTKMNIILHKKTGSVDFCKQKRIAPYNYYKLEYFDEFLKIFDDKEIGYIISIRYEIDWSVDMQLKLLERSNNQYKLNLLYSGGGYGLVQNRDIIVDINEKNINCIKNYTYDSMVRDNFSIFMRNTFDHKINPSSGILKASFKYIFAD